MDETRFQSWSLFDRKTGEIIQIMRCTEPEAAATAQAMGVSFIPNVIHDARYVIGESEIGPPPSRCHRMDVSAGGWVLDADAAWSDVRRERDARLAATDWAMQPDVPLSEERRAAFVTYRQALRDITVQADPTRVEWPLPP